MDLVFAAMPLLNRIGLLAKPRICRTVLILLITLPRLPLVIMALLLMMVTRITFMSPLMATF